MKNFTPIHVSAILPDRDPVTIPERPVTFVELMKEYNRVKTVRTFAEFIAERPVDDPSNKKTFPLLLRTFENNYDPSAEYESEADSLNADLLYSVAYALTYSVIKKILNVSASSVVYAMRSDLYREQTRQATLAYLDPLSYSEGYNKDGETVREEDKKVKKSIISALRETAGDGFDLVQDAVVKLLEEISKTTDLSSGYMERPYKVRRLKKKVRIQDESSVGGWETVETTIVQETFKCIRGKISASSSVESASDKYSYLEDYTTDEETGWEEVIYRRLSKYSQLADPVYDFNGAETVTVAVGIEDYTRVEETVAAMGLTARESAVLKYRLSGYGNKAIATALGITENSVKGARNTIRKKAERIGLDPIIEREDPEETEDPTDLPIPTHSVTPTPVHVKDPSKTPVYSLFKKW